MPVNLEGSRKLSLRIARGDEERLDEVIFNFCGRHGIEVRKEFIPTPSILCVWSGFFLSATLIELSPPISYRQNYPSSRSSVQSCQNSTQGLHCCKLKYFETCTKAMGTSSSSRIN